MTTQDLFREKILSGDREGIEPLTHAALDAKIRVGTIVNEYLMPAMEEVGRLYETGEIFIPEMLMSARAMQASMAILKPLIVGNEVKTAGRVVIGTVKGDLHDIGKTLASMMLESAGFAVYDLGVDVRPDRFVEAVREVGPQLVGMSAMLTTTMPNMKVTIDALVAAGLRDTVGVIVGGAPLTEAYAHEIGADAYAPDASAGVRRVKDWLARA